MKHLFSLIIAGLIVTIAMGQRVTMNRAVPISTLKIQDIDLFQNPMQTISKTGNISSFVDNIQCKRLKSAAVIKQKMDSAYTESYDANSSVWILGSKEYFSYDELGNVLLDITYSLDPYSQFQKSKKVEYLYNNAGDVTQSIVYNWDSNLDQWTFYSKSEYNYTEDKLTLKSDYLWYGTTIQWVVNGKAEYAYDGDGNITLDCSYGILNDTIWGGSRDEYTYDSSHNILQRFNFNWNRQWEPVNKYEYIYSDGKLIRLLRSAPDSILIWGAPYYKTDYSYEGGRLHEEIEYRMFDSWEKTYMYDYNYDINGFIIRKTHSINYSDIWFADAKEEFIFEPNGNRIFYGNYYRIAVNGTWYEKNNHRDYNYNNSYSYDDLILPWMPWNGDEALDYNHMLMSVVNSAYSSPKDKTTYYYSDNTFSIDDIDFSKVTVFPNPASAQVTFTWGSNWQQLYLEIFDVNGRIVLGKSISNKSTISVSQLPRGIYFYKLSERNTIVFKGKLSID
jgi:hypothetical protein